MFSPDYRTLIGRASIASVAARKSKSASIILRKIKNKIKPFNIVRKKPYSSASALLEIPARKTFHHQVTHDAEETGCPSPLAQVHCVPHGTCSHWRPTSTGTSPQARKRTGVAVGTKPSTSREQMIQLGRRGAFGLCAQS